MKNATEYKSGTLPTLASLGSFTISPYHLNKVLSAGEFHLLETLRYLTERNTLKRKPVSYSLLLVESRFTKPIQIKRALVHLILLKFVTIEQVDRKKGTFYRVNYDQLCKVVRKLNSEPSSIKRLQLADNYRKQHGLPPLNETKVKRYAQTPFDWEVMEKWQKGTTTVESTPEDSTLKGTDDYVRQIEELAHLVKAFMLSKRDYRQQCATLTDKAKEEGIEISLDYEALLNNLTSVWI